MLFLSKLALSARLRYPFLLKSSLMDENVSSHYSTQSYLCSCCQFQICCGDPTFVLPACISCRLCELAFVTGYDMEPYVSRSFVVFPLSLIDPTFGNTCVISMCFLVDRGIAVSYFRLISQFFDAKPFRMHQVLKFLLQPRGFPLILHVLIWALAFIWSPKFS